MVALLKSMEIAPVEEGSERRMFERTSAEGVVQGHRMDHTISARRNPRFMLDLRDLSLGGMAAMSEHPVERGEEVAVSFPRRGMNAPWNAAGRVVRCEPSMYGYRVAIEFQPLLAA